MNGWLCNLCIKSSGEFWQTYNTLLSQDFGGHAVCMEYAFCLLKILF